MLTVFQLLKKFTAFSVGFEVIRAVVMKSFCLFGYVMVFSLVKVYRHCEGTCHLHVHAV
jgi:hypothetical protein